MFHVVNFVQPVNNETFISFNGIAMESGPEYIRSMLKVLSKPSFRNILRCALCFGLWFGKGSAPRMDAADVGHFLLSQSPDPRQTRCHAGLPA